MLVCSDVQVPLETRTDRISNAILRLDPEGHASVELLIYDLKISDRPMLRLLQARLQQGVDVRVIGKVGKAAHGIDARKMPGMRLHVRAMVRDGTEAFVDSQGLRKLELDGRRELGVIVSDTAVARRMQEVFEEDWLATMSKAEAAALERPEGRPAKAAREPRGAGKG